MVSHRAQHVADRWMEEQLFEEDIRAVLTMLRPNRQERLAGWSEYRTGGKHFRATISWDKDFENARKAPRQLAVPNMTDVLETILIGSAKDQDQLSPADEFEIYRQIVRELYQRGDSLQACYEERASMADMSEVWPGEQPTRRNGAR